MFRVKIFRGDVMIAKFIDELLSQAVGKARKIGEVGDTVFVHEVVQTADGDWDEVECTLKTTV